MSDTDTLDDLMTLTREGDECAFYSLVEPLLPVLTQWVQFRGLSLADSEEIAQETILRMHSDSEAYRPGMSVRNWSLRIARLEIAERARRTGAAKPLAQSIHPFAELDCTTSESVGFETLDAPPTGQERELAAEVQDCAIELLALLIEEELSEWLALNRSALARELALAAHSFIVGFMRITARSPELYSLNSSDLTPLLLLPRN